MNRLCALLLLSVSIFLQTSCATTPEARIQPEEGVTTIKKTKPKKLRSFSEHTLSNGLRVLLIKDDSLPHFGLHMLVKSGYARDPEGASGTSQMMAALLEKGTQKRKAIQIADDLAQIGGDFDSAVDADFIYLSVNGLSYYREKLLENFVELITKPSFQDVEIERLRKQMLAKQQQTVDNASAFASLAYQDFLFSPHPYAKTSLGRRADVIKIKKTQIIRYYLENIRPNNAILAVVGDFPETVLSDLDAALKPWRPRNIKSVILGPVTPIQNIQMRLVHKADLNQSQIRMGHEGIPRSNKDYLTLRVANLILGQGFTSRLVDQIRDNLGLTYHISTEMDAQLNTGSFEISTFTRAEKTAEAIEEILKVYKKFVDEGVTAQEVESAKGYLEGGFGRSLETAERLAFNLLILRNYGLSDSYLINFEDNVSNISASEVNQVIKTYFRPERMKILVFANQSLVMPQLKNWQPIEVKSPKDLL